MRWINALWVEWVSQSRRLWDILRGGPGASNPPIARLPSFSFLGAAGLVGIGLFISSRVPASRYPLSPPNEVRRKARQPMRIARVTDDKGPAREIPDRFPANTQMPASGEGAASLSIGRVPFDPDRDLLAVWDDRVWWESEHDEGDDEDDHIMHFAMEEPLRRLIELVDREKGTLKVQDAYRGAGIHARTSLHKQGRAIDLTCDELGLERLAKLTWAAGFDWVYYEAPKTGGHHIHASVRPRPRKPTR